MFQAAEKKACCHRRELKPEQHRPDYIMASMLKKLDSCAYHAIASIVEDTYTGEPDAGP